MKHIETIIARGHNLIQATHKTTFEITKENRLTKHGDCIIAIAADKSMKDLSEKFKEAAKKSSAITIMVEADECKEVIKAIGDPALTFSHPKDIVIRKSSYICDRTLTVKADKSASDFSRVLIKKLRNTEQKIRITLTVNV